jgi:prophage regulatory protein
MANHPIQFLRLPQILRRVPYSEAHIWRLEKAGKFPRRVRLGANRVAWVESEVNKWVSSKLQERDR